MATTAHTISRIKRNHRLRWRLLEHVNHYMDLPIALASILMVLLALIQLNGHVSPGWQTRLIVLQTAIWLMFVLQFTIQFVLAPQKRKYLRSHWLNALVVVVPFIGFLKVLTILQATPSLPLFRLLIFGSRSLSSPIAILRRRRLGQLLLVSVLVMLIGAAVVDIVEVGTPGSHLKNFGDALWWSVTTVTTVGSSLDVVSPAGRIVGVFLMVYGLGVFSYVTASVASVLVGLDQQSDAKKRSHSGVSLTPEEIQTLQAILDRASGRDEVSQKRKRAAS